jgi:SNF2 family DNA or RNA helicase
MIVSPSEPFKLVFSLYEHEYLGYLIESYVAQLNSKGQITYKTQNISSVNFDDFKEQLEPEDRELVLWTDAIQQDEILKKFNQKKSSPQDFFQKIFDEEKGDKLLRDTILSYIDNYKREIFNHIKHKPLFTMGTDGIPTWKEIIVVQESAKAYFHFERQDDQTIYYPIIKCGDEKIKFQFKGGVIVNDTPAAMLLEGKLYLFDQYADGKKIKPFLNKPNIVIPKKIESTYYQKFIVPLVANFNVFAKGFEIIREQKDIKILLQITEIKPVKMAGLFANDDLTSSKNEEESKMVLELIFQYGDYRFKFDNFGAPANVFLEKVDDSWKFHKINRKITQEKEAINTLKNEGLDLRNGRTTLNKEQAINWITEHHELLTNHDIEVIQNQDNSIRYFLGYTKLEVKIEEKNDWFDIHTSVQFGPFLIPFIKLRKYILSGIKEFKLPDGQIAIIPNSWFTQYSELFESVEQDENESLILRKNQIGLVNHLSENGLAVTLMSRKLQGLRDFKEIEEVPLPKNFKGKLRPYQKAGYDWLNFLRNYNFGGCLADDMGLGKTVMTLAFLQKIKEEKPENPSLLVMPTSLIYNWQKEAQKFTPELKILIQFGTNRYKDTHPFSFYDLVICSYGVLRLDIDFLKKYKFNYVILDESQAIKNPGSQIFNSVIKLYSQNRLILTGTPLENSTMDLWTQMSFINPGLLGSMTSFRNQFQQGIEKQKNEDALKRLYARIKPFMLRRQKKQVAKDLPEKIETVQYCQMTEEQEKLYEETKSFIRNQILKEAEKGGIKRSSFVILQGLTKLRQLANNPMLVDSQYKGESGKDKDIMHKLTEVVQEGYKVLVFSQFTSHLAIIKDKLNQKEIPFLYLDGATRNRIELVERFQEDPGVKVFLISLKAGGVGLNLTAAEYVFMLDPWWNPAIEAQAIDRAHRIGQTKTVFSYKFISKNTVEEKILDLQNSKKKLFDDLITAEEGFIKSLNETDILELLD